MNKQEDHSRINSVEVRSAAALPNLEQTLPSDDILLEIRGDYREAKKQLKRYNKFIDRYPGVTVSTPLLLSFVGLVVFRGYYALSAWTSVGLLTMFFVLTFTYISRKSSADKIKHKMKDLRQEAASYQHWVALGEKNISRDELSLLQNETTNESGNVSGGLIFFGWLATILQFCKFWMALSIIASIISLIISIVLVASRDSTNKRNGKVILTIWIVINSIAFIVGFNSAQQAQQTANTQACMAGVVQACQP